MTGKSLKTVTTFILLIISIVIFLAGGVLAKEPRFRLDMDSLNLQKGVSANLTVSLVNVRGAEVEEIKGLKNFDVLSQSQSTSTNIINGDTTRKKNYHYIIMPKNTGRFTLQGKVKYNGSTYMTNELEINVSEASKIEEGEVKDLFIKTVISDDEIYFGQKVVLVYELYSRYNIENFGFLDDISLDGFILNDIPRDNLKANYTYLEGNKYVKYEARQTYLSPVKTGTFTIPSYNFQVNISTGDFFNSSKPVYLKTESGELKVKPLPLDIQPPDFSGIVGKLNLDSGYSRREVDYGDSITLKVTAYGNCNLENLNEIIKNDIPGFSVYQTENNMEEGIKNNRYSAQKEFEVILVPEKNGEISIDPIYISYFDPASGSYEKAEIPGATITVNGKMPQNQSNAKNTTTAVETVKIDQVDYNPGNEGYLVIQIKKDKMTIGLVIILGFSVLAGVLFIIVSYRKKQDIRLRNLYRQVKNTKDCDDIYNLLNSMIKHCFNLSLKANSRDIIKKQIADNELAGMVLEIIDYMESNKQNKKGDVHYLKDRIKEIYNRLAKDYLEKSSKNTNSNDLKKG